MKKPVTYYFLLVAGLDVFWGWFSGLLAAWMSEAFEARDVDLPAVSHVALACHWWPYAFAVVAVVFLCVSVFTRISSAALMHVVVGLILVQLPVLVFVDQAYLLGLMPPVVITLE